jgi:hypothetical protein
MSDYPARPVLGRPPRDGDDEELERWVAAFVALLLGPEEGEAGIG